MTTRIKICGFTEAPDPALIQEDAIDFVGINFVPHSPRCVTLERAMKIRNSLTHAKPVLIFENEDLEKALEIAKILNCTHVQFHGKESVDDLAALPLIVIKAYRFVPKKEELERALQKISFVLVDGTKNGELTDIERAAALPESIRSKLFLAGGLTPENVRMLIEKIHPYAVDSASGVESAPGIKDPLKLTAFIDAVHSASPAHS